VFSKGFPCRHQPTHQEVLGRRYQSTRRHRNARPPTCSSWDLALGILQIITLFNVTRSALTLFDIPACMILASIKPARKTIDK